MHDLKTAVEECPQQLGQAHLERFAQEGFLAFAKALSSVEVEAARQALSTIAQDLLAQAKAGKAQVRPADPKASRNYSGVRIVKPDSPCSIHFEPDVDPLVLDAEAAELKFRKLHGYHQEHPALVDLVNHPRIKGFMEQLIGQEVVLKGDMALSKPPFVGSAKPWHQDNAYFNWLPLHLVGTAWIALDDSTVDNGCMYVLPGAHKLGALKHFHSIDCEIIPDRIDKSAALPLELKAGSVLYFSAMLPHYTPPNRTATRRRALQFQFRGVETQAVSKEEFGRVFAEADGTPASCALAYEDG